MCAACRAGYKEMEGRCEQCSAGCATCEFAGPGSCDACKAGFASMKPAMPVELNCTFFGADGERIVWLAAGRRGKQVEWKMSAPAGDVAADTRAVFRTAYGATDEFGFASVEKKVHVHDLHATILHLMGLDHEKLTYRYSGRDFRLTDVHGVVVTDILK